MKWYQEYFSELKIIANTTAEDTELEVAEKRKALAQLKV
jgi:hypothetical protein